MKKSKKFKIPLLIIDIENLKITTHEVIPSGNINDVIEYEQILNKRSK